MNATEKSRQRVLRVSGINGWSILIVAGLFALISLLMGDGLGAFFGVAVLVSPGMELKARSLLKRGEKGARQWYLRSQIWLLSVIILYCLSQLFLFYSSGGIAMLPADVKESLLQALQFDEPALQVLMEKIYLAVYLTIIVVTLCYQGGLFFFYRRNVPSNQKTGD